MLSKGVSWIWPSGLCTYNSKQGYIQYRLLTSFSLEMNIGIIAATIPTLRPLFSKNIREGRKSGKSSSRYFGRSSNNRYARKGSGDSASRQLDDKEGLHNVELSSISSPVHTTDGKYGITVPSAFPSDEASFESVPKAIIHNEGKRGPKARRPTDDGYYDHSEDVFNRV